MERPDSCRRKTDILARKSCAPSDEVSTQNRRPASQIDINPSRPLTYRFMNKNIRTKIHGALIVRACVQLIWWECSRTRWWERYLGPSGVWRQQHTEELRDLCCSSDIVRVIKWRSKRWGRHVARMEGRAYMLLVEKPGGQKHCSEGNVDGRIILKWIIKRWECRQD